MATLAQSKERQNIPCKRSAATDELVALASLGSLLITKVADDDEPDGRDARAAPGVFNNEVVADQTEPREVHLPIKTHDLRVPGKIADGAK
jgi:hypothetical protein